MDSSVELPSALYSPFRVDGRLVWHQRVYSVLRQELVQPLLRKGAEISCHVFRKGIDRLQHRVEATWRVSDDPMRGTSDEAFDEHHANAGNVEGKDTVLDNAEACDELTELSQFVHASFC